MNTETTLIHKNAAVVTIMLHMLDRSSAGDASLSSFKDISNQLKRQGAPQIVEASLRKLLEGSRLTRWNVVVRVVLEAKLTRWSQELPSAIQAIN